MLGMYLTFFKIGLFGFGGGYAILPLIEEEIVKRNHWLTEGELVDIIAISQITPGPIAINGATFVGYKLGGTLGSGLATLGVISASFIIVLIVSNYVIKNRELPWLNMTFSALRPIVMGFIISAAFSVGKAAITDVKSLLIGLGGLGLLLNTKIHPILVIVLGGVAGVVLYM